MSEKTKEKKEKKVKKERFEKRKTSIRGRLQFDIRFIVGLAVITLAIITVILNCVSTLNALRSSMMATAEVTAERINQELQVSQAVVSELGTNNRIASNLYNEEHKQILIDQRVKDYNMVAGGVLDTSGINLYSGEDLSNYEFFKKSITGENYISEPVSILGNGSLNVVISAPVWESGLTGNPVMGVVYMVADSAFLSDIAAGITISKNSGCYMLSSSGITIGHTNAEIADSQENTIEMSKTDRSLKNIAKLEQKMINGENGCGFYTYGGTAKIMAYSPIPNTSGWSISLNAPVMDFMSSTIFSVVISAIIAAAAFALGAHAAKSMGNVIGTPIELCSKRLTLLSQGDLHSEVPQIDTKDETRILADATATLVSSLEIVIQDADYMLEEMSKGNFSVVSDKDEYYVGDFKGLSESVKTLNRELNKTLLNISQAVEQVNVGAAQMAQTAQGLAEGATDQAGAVEELQATIINVTNIVEDSAKSLKDAYGLTKDYQQNAIESGNEMNDLTVAMQSITDTSEQINNIIVDIEEIASQTNLLSLNAAIEAARAGEAGKGFAVVADQIRKLAEDSASSAVRTRELIEASLLEIEKGNQIAERTQQSLMKVVDGMDVLAEQTQKAMDNSQAQAEAMEQIEQGIEQISMVVQNNSATAEETSATSEELSAQASNINQMVNAFKLRMY